MSFSVLMLALLGCQSEQQASSSSEATVIASEHTEKPLKTHVKKACLKGTSPQVQNKAKLKEMLVKSGKITAQMTATEANKIINDYIKKKQDAFKNCTKKEGK